MSKLDTPMLDKMLERISLEQPTRLMITPLEYVQLRAEVLSHYSSVEFGVHALMPPPDELTGFAGYLYGVPLFVGKEDKLIKAAQKAVNKENDGSDRSPDR